MVGTSDNTRHVLPWVPHVTYFPVHKVDVLCLKNHSKKSTSTSTKMLMLPRWILRLIGHFEGPTGDDQVKIYNFKCIVEGS